MLQRFIRVFIIAAVGLLVFVAPSLRADTLHLKDGRVLEGRLVREGDGFVYFAVKVGSIEKTELFTKDQVTKLVKEGEAPAPTPVVKPQQAATTTPPKGGDVPGAVPAAGAGVAGAAGVGGKSEKPKEAASTDDGATRVCFISIEEEVGMLLNADAIEHSVNLVKDQKPEVIVLVVNSGGGALLEVEPLSDLIHEKLKKDYRTVSWIRSAISAAAMTALNCEEIYMMREGHIGGATAYVQESGRTKAVEGADLEEILEMGKELARRGGRNPIIVKAMQVFTDLSCDIDEHGVITWYENKQGKYVVSTKDRILTFNSADSLKFGISKGTADTKDELMRIMGISEWKEVGPEADAYQQEFRANVTSLQARAGELMTKLNMAMQTAAGASGDEKERAKYVGRARQVLNELRALVKRAPSFEKYTIFRKEWFEARDEDLRRLLAGKGLPSGGGGGGGLGGPG